jgi:hypothetical protein
MEKLQPGMQNLCANFLGHLVNNGFFEGIRSEKFKIGGLFE